MFSGENRRKIIVIAILAVLFIGYVLVDKSGILRSIQLPTGQEWFFNLIELMLPLAILGLAIWKKQRMMALASGLITVSALTDFAVRMQFFPNGMYYLSLALMFLGCTVMIAISFGQKLSAAWARWLGFIPALSGLAFLVLFPLDAGFYSVLIAIMAAIISFSAAYLCFAGFGEILAFAGFLLMASKFAVHGNAWIAWLTPLLTASGFFLAGLSITSVQGQGVDKD